MDIDQMEKKGETRMAERVNKRYYWLQLSEGFFRDKKIKKLRKIAGGDTYTIIYLKLMLATMNTSGILTYEGVEDSLAEEVALELDEDEENVQVTLNYLIHKGLMQEINTGEFLLPQVPECIGSETASTRRSRLSRENQKTLQCNTKTLQCNTNATPCNETATERREENIREDIDIDIENIREDEDIEKKREIELEESKKEREQNSPAPASKKPEKHIHGEYKHVRLTDEELQKLESEFGAIETQEAITYLDEYIEMKGAKYKSHYLALRKWVFDAVKETKQRKERNQNAGSTKSQKLAQELEDDYQMLAQWANT
jgi:predicted phage replisome organizer